MSEIIIRAVSFATEGPPHDEGIAFTQDDVKIWEKACLDGGATTF